MFKDEPTEVCMQHTGRKGTLWRTVDVLTNLVDSVPIK